MGGGGRGRGDTGTQDKKPSRRGAGALRLLGNAFSHPTCLLPGGSSPGKGRDLHRGLTWRRGEGFGAPLRVAKRGFRTAAF